MKNFYDNTNATYKTTNDESVRSQDVINAARTAAEVLYRTSKRHFPTLELDDLFNETVCRSLEGIHRFDSRKASLKTLVSRIALHYLIDFQRREKKRTAMFDSFTWEDKDGQEYVSAQIAGYRGDEFETDRDLRMKETLDEIDGAFAKLCGSRGMVLRLAGEGFKPREIAEITGWDANKVSVLLCRGRKDLAGQLGGTLREMGIAA
ncbi:MAG: RNA polymerase sigma factor [Bacteroidales bacterium]|nr:RNA polymerase sigma factor [Bacteroidales bacterium]